jgi:hypothetical protein
MVTIAQNHWGMVTGTFTSIIDGYMNLREYKEIKLVTINKMKPSEIISLFFKNEKFGCGPLMASFTKGRVIDDDTIICSARLLVDAANDDSIQIRAKRLIVLDSLDLARKKYMNGPDFDQSINADECIFLVNPANKGMTNHKEYTYYHKFNRQRMDSMFIKDRKLSYNRSKKPFIKVGEGQYFENIGKGIFEYSYKGYPIKYNTEGMFTKDGLFYYMRLCGVDGSINHDPLIIPKSKIIKQLCMNENDLLLDLI